MQISAEAWSGRKKLKAERPKSLRLPKKTDCWQFLDRRRSNARHAGVPWPHRSGRRRTIAGRLPLPPPQLPMRPPRHWRLPWPHGSTYSLSLRPPSWSSNRGLRSYVPRRFSNLLFALPCGRRAFSSRFGISISRPMQNAPLRLSSGPCFSFSIRSCALPCASPFLRVANAIRHAPARNRNCGGHGAYLHSGAGRYLAACWKRRVPDTRLRAAFFLHASSGGRDTTDLARWGET